MNDAVKKLAGKWLVLKLGEYDSSPRVQRVFGKETEAQAYIDVQTKAICEDRDNCFAIVKAPAREQWLSCSTE
tara:strand:+ start:14214 stop:14432 length:219 start_codon:yes stop_codon:yes gene_type:complete